jgi:FG-GAP-like repeat
LNARCWVTAAVAAVALTGCTTFPVIESGVCGNAVVDEPLEDCDTFPDRDLKGSACRPKGELGACHFDCSLHADGTRALCPDSMGCAPDGICRKPSGEFEAPAPLSGDVSSWVSSADFDGDGRPELLSAEPADQRQQSHFRVHYFDPDGKLLETRRFPRTSTRPVASKLNHDPQDDLVFSNFRVGMLPGRRDKEWVPATFSSYVVPDSTLRIAPVSNGVVNDNLALVALTTLEGTLGLYVPSAGQGRLLLRATLPRPLQELAGEPLTADLFDVPTSPCLELVVAYVGDDFLRVFDMCQIGEGLKQTDLVWRDEPREQVVRLPHGVKIEQAPFSADVNGDGHLDLLVSSEGQIYVSLGDGATLQSPATAFELPLTYVGDPPRARLLAAGDVSGDGLADFVFADQVFISRRSLVDASVGYFPSFFNNALPWTTALVGDLNGNGLLDVIAGTEGAPGLSFLSGTGTPYQVPARISTQGPLRLLASGDYDGDLIADVALVEGGSPGAPADALAIAFGTRDRVPESPVRIAELGGIEQLGSQRDGGLDDVFTASTGSPDGAPRGQYTLFGGDADRLPFAPYTLNTFSVDGNLQDWDASALVVGQFSASGTKDVLALGTHKLKNDPRKNEDHWNQWLIPDVASGQQPPRLLSVTVDDAKAVEDVFPTLDPAGQTLSAAGIAADVDGDGIDEALWLMPIADGSTCALLVYDFDPDSAQATLKSRLDLDAPCATPELAAAQLVGNRALDLLLLLGDPRVGARRLELFYNDGSGNFSLENRSFVGDGEADVRGFSLFPGKAAAIAFVTDDAVHVARTSDAGQYDQLRDLGGLHDARSVTVTDPNGDGVSDLVVADADGLWLVKAALQ